MNEITQGRFSVDPSASDHFAWLRTRLAIERTFLAWLRTAASLIGFGFTIVQFFERLKGMEASNGHTIPEEMPRNLGLALIAAGVGSLLISAFQYRSLLHYLWSTPFAQIAGVSEKPHWTPAFVSAVVLMGIGIAAFISVFFRFM